MLGESQEWLLLPIGPQSPLTISKYCSILKSRCIYRDSVGLGLYGHPIYEVALVQPPACVMIRRERKRKNRTLHPEDLAETRGHNRHRLDLVGFSRKTRAVFRPKKEHPNKRVHCFVTNRPCEGNLLLDMRPVYRSCEI